MADLTSATLLRATGWQRSLGGGMEGRESGEGWW